MLTTRITVLLRNSLPSDRGAIRRRRLLAAAGVALVLLAIAGALALSATDPQETEALVLRSEPPRADPLAYESGQDEELERAAIFGLSHPLYAKSPGGVIAAARRTARFRPLVDGAVRGTGISADMVEAIVFLESGGRPEVIAGDDPARASV